jgi:hypothetical protein
METTIPIEHMIIIKSFRFILTGSDATTFWSPYIYTYTYIYTYPDISICICIDASFLLISIPLKNVFIIGVIIN